ncbi:MAG: RNA methyltransferase [Oleiphilaceae bacterium]|nr:RNA methyltransferase [Oleiphilaceae bacterium]
MNTTDSDKLLASLTQQVQIVLVETTHSGNIGAVARAMKNMGLYRLVLVSPRTFPSEEATSRASGADDVLQNARVVACLEEAIAESSLVIGSSARSRNMVWPLINPRTCAQRVLGALQDTLMDEQTNSQGHAPAISLVFGRESSGLTNEELQRCHYHVNIPANPDYSSLNLAMAVQVVCYELRMAALLEMSHTAPIEQVSEIEGPQDQGWDTLPATVNEVEGLLTHLEETLIQTGFHDPDNPRMLMVRLRRFIQRARPDTMEVNILRGILKSIQRSLGAKG